MCPAYAQGEAETQLPQSREHMKLSFAPLVKKVAPAVVNIYTKRNVATGFRHPFADDPFFGQFFRDEAFGGGMRKQIEGSLGSGVILTAEGLVVTNAHVIRGADVITVGLSDGREFDATVALSDDASDLALLRIHEKGVSLPFVTLKASESLEVGDLVLAIGNPFGVGQTVTSGIVSAQGRSSLDINDFNFFIQTDAAINPGNSGGPLVDMAGNVVGINTAIYSRSGGSMGIGFAIPAEMVESVLAAESAGQVGKTGVLRPWLGAGAQDVTAEIAASLGLEKPTGALLSELHSASPFQKAGLKVGDIILMVNNKTVKGAAELKFRMATIPIGQEADVEVFRAGEILRVKVSAIAPPNDPPREELELKGKHALNGAIVANLNPAVAVELGLSGDEEGVIVTQVRRGSVAARFLSAGVIIREINGHEIKMPSEIEAALKEEIPQGGLLIVLEVNGRTSQIYVR